jgi:hypothetical protein
MTYYIATLIGLARVMKSQILAFISISIMLRGNMPMGQASIVNLIYLI